jgi:tetratricopeptide (TPR) repeat protein
VRSLRRHTILKQTPCDLKALPLSAVDGCVLTLIDGRSTLADIAEANEMTLAQIFPHADRLLELGAVSVVGEKGRAAEAPGEARARKTPVPGSTPPVRHPSGRRTAQIARPSHRAIERAKAAAATATVTPPAVLQAGPALDEVVLARILAFHARLVEVDHYALLALERGAEKVAIKRAYFALAAEFHPDRYFGKDLGKAGPALQRIFTRLTEAHDTLVNRARRADYDATLPPAPAPQAPPVPAPAAVRRATSRALPAQRVLVKRSTRKMKSVEAPPEPAPLAPKPPSTPPPPSVASPPAAPPGAVVPPGPTTVRRSPQAEEALRRLYYSAKQDEVRRRAGVFVSGAEEAMRRDDLITAANHYRLALQSNEDPAIRAKLDAIEGTSRERVHARSLTRGRGAELGERWADAASYFGQAYAANPDAATAERAANALRKAGGDLRRAVELAEEAVRLEPKKAAYRVTLGEVCLAANLVKRAAGEAERALALDPGDAAAKALAAAARKR